MVKNYNMAEWALAATILNFVFLLLRNYIRYVVRSTSIVGEFNFFPIVYVKLMVRIHRRQTFTGVERINMSRGKFPTKCNQIICTSQRPDRPRFHGWPLYHALGTTHIRSKLAGCLKVGRVFRRNDRVGVRFVRSADKTKAAKW